MTPVSRRHPVPAGELTYEPSERWVRGTIGDQTIVDSRRPLLLWDPGQAVPRYVFPVDDVRDDLLEPVGAPPEREQLGATQWYDVVVNGRRYERLAWRYDSDVLADHVAFDWFRRTEPGVEHWFEEEEEVFRHPRDPYKRVDAIPSSRSVEISVDGRVLAQTTEPVLLFETRLPIRYYIPPTDVDFSALQESDLLTQCPYKGTARYWSIRDTPDGANLVWAYEHPLPSVAAIKGHLAFYNEVADIAVDGVALKRPISEFSHLFSQVM